MAGEVEASPRFLSARDLVHGPALHDPGIPVDEHAALHIGVADKAEQSMPRPIAAPAVLGAQIFFACAQTASRNASSLPSYHACSVCGTSSPAVTFRGLGQRHQGQPLPLENTAVISNRTGSSATSRT